MPKIYTKTGDKGKTSFYNCNKTDKDNELIDITGEIDELNSFIGLIKLEDLDDDFNIYNYIKQIQSYLCDLSTLIAYSEKKYIFDVDLVYTKGLENYIDIMTLELPKLQNFILSNNIFHTCRTITRRVERKLVSVMKKHSYINDNALIYINRLSDYFFTLARYITFKKNISDVIYHKSSILTEY